MTQMRGDKALALVFLAGLLLFSLGAGEQGLKMGIVDLEQALASTEEGKAAREEMGRKQREAEQKVQPMVDRFNEMKEEIKSKKFVLSDESLFQKQLDLAELQNEIQSNLKELEGQLKVDEERLYGPLRAKMIEIVGDVGKDQGFTVIMARGSPGLLYTREAIDITDAVIQKFNQKKKKKS
jgi:outer membrane protein